MLSPVLVSQAMYINRTALNLPEPTGDREGEFGSGDKLRLLVIGDSSAAGVGVETQEEALGGQLVLRLAKRFDVKFKIVAKTGATTSDVIKMLREEPRETYDVAVLAVCTNDLTHGTLLNRFLVDRAALISLLRDRFGVSLQLHSGFPPLQEFPLLPQPLRWALGQHARHYDARLKSMLARHSDCRYSSIEFPVVPAIMAEDGYHPGALVYHEWAGRVARQIMRNIDKIKPTANNI